MKIPAYVINLNHRTDRLQRFQQQSGAEIFERVPAIDGQLLKIVHQNQLDSVFNIKKAQQNIKREVTAGEIACALSHILCWKKIAHHPNIADDDFGLVAEDDVTLTPHFLENLNTLITQIKQSSNQLVILQKFTHINMLPEAADLIEQFSFAKSPDIRFYLHSGAALYLLRKQQAKEIIHYLEHAKPFWLADEFLHFCPLQKISIPLPLLGKIIDNVNAESDLEFERKQARQRYKQEQSSE